MVQPPAGVAAVVAAAAGAGVVAAAAAAGVAAVAVAPDSAALVACAFRFSISLFVSVDNAVYCSFTAADAAAVFS
jgi:hypothetical protein